MQGNFTKKAQQALEEAKNAAAQLGRSRVGTEHILVGLLRVKDCVAAKTLENQGVTAELVEEKIAGIIGSHDSLSDLPRDYTPRTKRVIDGSVSEAQQMGNGYVGTEHLLLSLMNEQDCIGVKLLLLLGVSPQRVYEDMMLLLNDEEQDGEKTGKQGAELENSSPTSTLDKYSRDLTSLAKEGKFDPIVGREQEIERIIQILSRRTKNNPCLMGDPGVGKTAIVEGLAQRVADGAIPATLKDKRIISVDLSSMVAGSKYRGEFEDRLKKALEEVRVDGNIILFIDEIHTIIGAGAAEGAIDASNILKPSLARGELQLIGATTVEEYRKYIEKDAALERRFQPIMVEEPTEEEAISMLLGLKDKYEAHHNVRITEEAVQAAVKLSSRYINDRFLPDKAIDLVDEAASALRLKSYVSPPELKELEESLDRLEQEKKEAICTEEFEKAGKIKAQQEVLREELAQKQAAYDSKMEAEGLCVTAEEIADVVSRWTGIPAKSIQNDESQRLMQLEETLHKKIIGQQEAVTAIAKAIRRGRVGLKNPNRPIGSFLFLGPTGVGKTELSKALAQALFGDADAMIRIDMSEYMEKHSVSRLVGSPPGYVGYEQGGQLSEKVRRKPYSVVLFDEIEKAAGDVFNILLQILDDGHITDSQGRKVDFKNTVIIMTSNAGAQSIVAPKKLGFTSGSSKERDYEEMKRGVMEEVKRIFRPEFLNRIDDILVFHPLDEEDIQKIVQLMLHDVVQRAKENMGISLAFTPEAVGFLAKKGYDPSYGARPLRRAIQTEVEDGLAEEFLMGKLTRGANVQGVLEGEKIQFTVE